MRENTDQKKLCIWTLFTQCKTPKGYDKAVNTCPSTIEFVPECYKTKECEIDVILFMIINCPDRYKTQRMFDEATDDCLATLKFILGWFVTRKMLEMVQDALKSNDDILFFDEDFSKVTFFAIKWVFWM